MAAYLVAVHSKSQIEFPEQGFACADVWLPGCLGFFAPSQCLGWSSCPWFDDAGPRLLLSELAMPYRVNYKPIVAMPAFEVTMPSWLAAMSSIAHWW